MPKDALADRTTPPVNRALSKGTVAARYVSSFATTHDTAIRRYCTKWRQFQTRMGDIGLSDSLPTDEDFEPPFSGAPPRGGASPPQPRMEIESPKPGMPVASLTAFDFAK